MNQDGKDELNLVIVPFHDWRKIVLEGFRTRDAHFIEELGKREKCRIVIINRPTTIAEILLKRKPNLIKSKVLLAKSNFRLYEIKEGMYLIDYISYDFIGQIFKGYRWFIDNYSHRKYHSFIREALEVLGISNQYYLLNQNIFAFDISKRLSPIKSVFDAWDNFMKFKVYSSIKDEIHQGYTSFSESCDFWITNSSDNLETFHKIFKPNQIHLIKNGVDITRFSNNIKGEILNDFKDIPRPIVGFGGKITQLIDVELLNKTMALSPHVSFVFVGQILDKEVYERINKPDNFYYLGDIHYDLYPNYVENFDVCIVPYVVEEEKKSGANTIKVYEYLAMKKKVIGTNSNGLEDLKEHLYIVGNAEDFAFEIANKDNTKKEMDIGLHSWVTKTEKFLNLLH